MPDAFPAVMRKEEGEHGGSYTMGILMEIDTRKCDKEAGRRETKEQQQKTPSTETSRKDGEDT